MNKLEKMLVGGITLGIIATGVGKIMRNDYLTYLGFATVIGTATYGITAHNKRK